MDVQKIIAYEWTGEHAKLVAELRKNHTKEIITKVKPDGSLYVVAGCRGLTVRKGLYFVINRDECIAMYYVKDNINDMFNKINRWD